MHTTLFVSGADWRMGMISRVGVVGGPAEVLLHFTALRELGATPCRLERRGIPYHDPLSEYISYIYSSRTHCISSASSK